jgi:hypothetical protein
VWACVHARQGGSGEGARQTRQRVAAAHALRPAPWPTTPTHARAHAHAHARRLTQYLHKLYTSNRAYYAASTLGGLTHADQRITEDVEKFCFSISDLYSHTFKVWPRARSLQRAQQQALPRRPLCVGCACS